MKILYISDLHCEFYYNQVDIIQMISDKVNADQEASVLVIAGDLTIGGCSRATDELISIATKISIPIIFVAGNHEYYKTDFPLEMSCIKANILKLKNFNVHWLEGDRSYVEIDGVLFVGGTGWIDGSWCDIHEARWVTPEINRLNDFRMIDHYVETLLYGRKTYHEIKNTLNDTSFPTVVITHYIPTPELIHSDYRGDDFNVCFANKWTDLFTDKNKPLAWIFGHSHQECELSNFKGVDILCNPLGYPDERFHTNTLRKNLQLGKYEIL